MARVKTALITRKKHKKILKRAKGYYGAKHHYPATMDRRE